MDWTTCFSWPRSSKFFSLSNWPRSFCMSASRSWEACAVCDWIALISSCTWTFSWLMASVSVSSRSAVAVTMALCASTFCRKSCSFTIFSSIEATTFLMSSVLLNWSLTESVTWAVFWTKLFMRLRYWLNFSNSVMLLRSSTRVFLFKLATWEMSISFSCSLSSTWLSNTSKMRFMIPSKLFTFSEKPSLNFSRWDCIVRMVEFTSCESCGSSSIWMNVYSSFFCSSSSALAPL